MAKPQIPQLGWKFHRPLDTVVHTHCLFAAFAALRLLTDPDNVPAMINCAHGKDRTGVVAALALWCAGWSKDEIVADYAQSQVQRHFAVYHNLFYKRHTGFTTMNYDSALCSVCLCLDWVYDAVVKMWTLPLSHSGNPVYCLRYRTAVPTLQQHWPVTMGEYGPGPVQEHQ